MKSLSERFARRTAEQRIAPEHGDRRQRGRGGRRRGDRGRPWWQKGLFIGALCAVLRYWRLPGKSGRRAE